MHFSIPDTEEFIDGVGNSYLGYSIHINGLYHCTVRYKQLHSLHEQLSKELADITLPAFPPKKFFPLTITQQEDRRLQLEKYIQTIGQNVNVNRCDLLNGFLINAQQESLGKTNELQNLDVYLANGHKIPVLASSGDNSNRILKKIFKQINLPERFIPYFLLFIIVYEEDGNAIVLRRLQDFESPLLTYKSINLERSRVVLSKCYWDIDYDCQLMKDPVALNLLYVQATAEIERGWILLNGDTKNRLDVYQKKGRKQEYVDLARTLKYYGYIQFAPCYCDYPTQQSKVLVAVGRDELNLRIFSENEQEAVFKVTRMRCWRITTLHDNNDKSEDNSDYSLELSFEYLMARDKLQWITISSEQSILMSVCLQSMIDELLMKSMGESKKVQEVSGRSWTYVTRDGASKTIINSSYLDSTNDTHNENDNNLDTATISRPMMKKLTDKLSAMKARSTKPTSIKSVIARSDITRTDTMENNAFHFIGDDDL